MRRKSALCSDSAYLCSVWMWWDSHLTGSFWKTAGPSLWSCRLWHCLGNQIDKLEWWAKPRRSKNVTRMNERKPTCFISYDDYRPSSNPHALRIDHRRAQKSCNGAICCWAPLLEHAPGKKTSIYLDFFWEIWTHTQSVTNSQTAPHILAQPHTHVCTHFHTGPQGSMFHCVKNVGVLPRGKFEPRANSWATH